MYEYLIGSLMVGAIWLFFFFFRRDLRKPILWSSAAYMLFNIVAFAAWRFFASLDASSQLFVPHYWNPDTLFDLGRITGGLAIEDALFMFFIGGIASAVYEFSFGKRIVLKRSYHPHVRALFVGLGAAAIYGLLFNPNPIWPLIVFGFVGALFLWIERRDLVIHSLMGALAFLVVYALAFDVFLAFFPDFITQVYNLDALSGIVLLGLPLEEHLYALSFGLLWAPLYEYAHGERDADIRGKRACGMFLNARSAVRVRTRSSVG